MPVVSIGEVMKAYAADAEIDARGRGTILDYSEASMESVDEILEAIAAATPVPQQATTDDVLWLFSKKYGGYLGQVVIKLMGGRWELEDLPDGNNARVVLICNDIRGFPLEKIYQRLTGDQFAGVAGYCRALRAILKNCRDASE